VGKRTVAEMTAETLREMAILSAVFFALDNLMKDDRAQAFPLNVTIYFLLGCIVVYAVGIIIERMRPERD
jgi:cytochrome c oxidase assembly factor CtaG